VFSLYLFGRRGTDDRHMTVSFWKPRNANERRLKLVDHAILWLMIGLTLAGAIPHLAASWSHLIWAR